MPPFEAEVTGYTSGYFGQGEPMRTPHLPRLSYFPMRREMNSMGRTSGMRGDFTYNQLRARYPTTLNSTKQWRESHPSLTGNTLRYVGSFDDKTLSESGNIPIRKGENVRVAFQNITMMRHPLHLHGHFLRLVNAQDANLLLQHTFDSQSMGKVTIEFDANEDQDWFSTATPATT